MSLHTPLVPGQRYLLDAISAGPRRGAPGAGSWGRRPLPFSWVSRPLLPALFPKFEGGRSVTASQGEACAECLRPCVSANVHVLCSQLARSEKRLPGRASLARTDLKAVLVLQSGAGGTATGLLHALHENVPEFASLSSAGFSSVALPRVRKLVGCSTWCLCLDAPRAEPCWGFAPSCGV